MAYVCDTCEYNVCHSPPDPALSVPTLEGWSTEHAAGIKGFVRLAQEGGVEH